MIQSGSDVATVLTIDVGTSSTRATLFDSNGGVLGSAKELNSRCLHDNGELDTEELWSLVVAAIRKVVQQTGCTKVDGIVVSALLGTIFLNSAGSAIGPALTWLSQHALGEVPKVQQLLGEATFYRAAGRRPTGEDWLSRILWFQRQYGDLGLLWKCLSIKDYLNYRLTGIAGIDLTHASYSGLLDVSRRSYNGDFLRALDLPETRLPQVSEAGQVVGQVDSQIATCLGIDNGSLVICGGPDGTMAALGAGAVEPGIGVNVAGTTDVFLTPVAEPVFDREMRLVTNCYALPRMWAVGGPMGMTGGCLEWFVRNLFPSYTGVQESKKGFELVDVAAGQVPAGSEGLLFLTELTGQRAPGWDPHSRGAVVGLTPRHTAGHLARAIMEGTSYALRVLIEAVEQNGVGVDRVRLIGGGAGGALLRQIRTDVTGKVFEVTNTTEATSLGSLMLGLVALGVYRDVKEAADQLVRVETENSPGRQQKVYEEYYRAYVELRANLRPSFKTLTGIA